MSVKWHDGKPRLSFGYPSMSREDFIATADALHRDCIEKGQPLAPLMRACSKQSLFYFCIYVLHWTFLNNDFAYSLCCMCQDEGRWGRMWLLAREHYKSTVITIAETVRDILLHPELTTCIYSYRFDSAKDLFFTPIKNELDHNQLIREIWPDVVYAEGEKPETWTATSLNVKRTGRRKEFTLTCASIFSQLTGSHYDQLVFDDCVIEENCQTSDRIAQTQKQWELSLNTGNTKSLRYCVIGTYYAYGDLYCHIAEKQLCEVITQPCFDTEGNGVLYSREALQEKKKILGSAVFATQMLLDPKSGSSVQFRHEDIMWWRAMTFVGLNVYTFVDPAGEVSRHRDNTVIITIGLDSADNFYVIDMIRDKLTLTQKTEALFHIKRTYNPRLFFYEKNGSAIDVPHILLEQERYNFRFPIQALVQTKAKGERIESLMPLFEQHRVYFPEGGCVHRNWEGRDEDMLRSFIDQEYMAYPHCTHDDAIDDLANILHPTCVAQMQRPDAMSMEREIYEKLHAKGMTMRPFDDDVPDDPLGDYRGGVDGEDTYSSRFGATSSGYGDWSRSYNM